MNAKELIVAAKFVKEAYCCEFDLTQYEGSALNIANHILATVREDDDVLITEEWLLLVGFIKQACRKRKCREEYNRGIVRYSPHWHRDFSGQWFVCEDEINIKTRGQLRKLLEALGVSYETK